MLLRGRISDVDVRLARRERGGAGNVVPYVALQAYAVGTLLVLATRYPSRYTRGGDLYGTFPIYGVKNTNNNNFDSSPDQLGNGSLLPVTSVDQLGATMGKWFGLSDSQLLDVFPNLANFGARDLGFMNPA